MNLICDGDRNARALSQSPQKEVTRGLRRRGKSKRESDRILYRRFRRPIGCINRSRDDICVAICQEEGEKNEDYIY